MSETDIPHFDSLWHGFNLSSMYAGVYGTQNDAAIGVVDGKIAWVGAASRLPRHTSDWNHNLNGGWVTPGLIDCHTHLVFGGNRANEFEQRLQGKSYEQITALGGGIASTVRATRHSSEYDLVQMAMPKVRALMASGVTTVEIKSGYGLDQSSEIKMLRAARELEKLLPISVKTTCLAAHAMPYDFSGDKDAYIDYLCNHLLPVVASSGLADAVDGFCESIGFTAEQIDRYLAAAVELGFDVKLHAEQLSSLGGASIAAKHRALSADHLEYVTEEDVAAMAAASTTAVLLPGAYYALNETKKPPIDLFRKHKVPMAIATDLNPGTSPALSLPLMMNMACTLFGLTPEESLAGTTTHAAKALGISDTHGELSVGKAADFICWDINSPANLSYWIGGDLLKARVKAGVLSNV